MNGMRNKICTIAFLGLALGGFYSCSEDSMPPEGERLTQAELNTILSIDEIAGIADDAIADLYNGNTAKSPVAKDNECYSAEYLESGFVATFNNCVLNGTDDINGTVTVSYATGEGSATFTATYEDFYVGTTQINGTRTYALASGSDENTGSFTVTSDMSVVFEDGGTISESGSKTLTIGYNETDQVLTMGISGEWTVETDEHTYAVKTIEDLEWNSSCAYLTKGSMLVSKSGLEVTVDFGDGSCDDKATLIYPNGATEVLTL